MAEITETRTVRVRYINEASTVEEYRQFGWMLTNKTLLNRFGNPLPIDARLSDDDLREKCSYDLSFRRTVEESVSNKLTMLQMEYDNNVPTKSGFGGGRITGIVFLSIFFIITLGLVISYFFRVTKTIGQLIAFVTLNQLATGGIVAISVTGASSVKRAARKNNELELKRGRILIEARQLLNK